jgi:hypothetical protein
MKKYRITTTHTVIASSQQEALAKLAKITASTAVTAARPKNLRKVADELADQMIEVAAKYANKWGRTSGVGFVTIYGTTSQGITLMTKNQLVKYLEKQKANLIDIIENDGVATQGYLKGKQIDLTEGNPEDIVFETFIRNMARLGIAIAASSKNGEKVLLEVFNKLMYFRTGGGDIKNYDESLEGVSGGIQCMARVTIANIKPAFQDGIAGWEKMFKVLNKAA